MSLSMLSSREMQWAQAISAVFRPTHTHEVDVSAAYRQVMEALPIIARCGVRVALWIVALAPLWYGKQRRAFHSLSAVARADLLSALLSHRWFVVRECSNLLKMVACLANFRDAEVARATQFYRKSVVESGVRSLTVLDQPVLDEEGLDEEGLDEDAPWPPSESQSA